MCETRFLQKIEQYFIYKSVWLRKSSNTSDAIIEFLISGCFHSLFDSKRSPLLHVYLDFSKVFDVVNQGILMRKLLHNGSRGVMHGWFKSYLSNWKQYVLIKNCSSSLSNITLSVPQGSVLGPVFFILCINNSLNSLIDLVTALPDQWDLVRLQGWMDFRWNV